MKLVAYYSIYNEADFIHESLSSIYDNVDRIIIIEGSWKETYEVNGNLRSTDGTIKIVKNFIQLYDCDNKIEYYEHNENDQIAQRNALWNYLKEDCVLLLVDGDEVWEEIELKKLKEVVKDWPDQRGGALPPMCYTVDSLTFVNDLYTYTPIRFPRVWELEKGLEYKFIEPNRIVLTNKFSEVFDRDFDKKDLNIRYFHYSYCHSPKRFIEKKKERTKKHGSFSWEIRNGLVQKDGVNFKEFTEQHPESMRYHKKIGKRSHKNIEKPEVIVYVEHSGIGNLVLSTPLLRALRDLKPNAEIYVVSWERAYRIIEGIDWIDYVIGHPHELNQLINKQIDHLIISPVGAVHRVTELLIRNAISVHSINITPPWTKHEAEFKLSFARKLGWKGKPPPCEIKLFDYQISNAKKILRSKGFGRTQNLVGICAAYLKHEHWPLKHWGNEKFAAFIDQMHQEIPEARFVLLGSQQDCEDANKIARGVSATSYAPVLNLCGISSDIKDTAAIISLCRIFIGNDSGLMHIAAALQIPTVTTFTFTNPVKNQPFGNCGKIVMVPCEHRMSCQHGQWQHCKDNGCLDLSTDKVLMSAKQVWRF